MKFDLYIFNSMYSISSSMSIKASLYHNKGFPGGSVVKNPPASAGDAGSIPAEGISHGEGNGNPLQYSYLGNLIS